MLLHSFPLTYERLMGNNSEMPGREDQGIAGNARGGLVSFAEAAVNDDQLAAALDGALAFAGLHRNMAVDDVAVRSFQTEFLQQHIAGSL